MCGIICSTSEISVNLQKIAHRGPDGIDIFMTDELFFGFTRLSINDKTNLGMQPFIYKSYIGLFNGEIYNHKSLINKYNLSTRSHSDMEIVLPLFDKIGNDILHELDGFYSGVIFDKETKAMFVIKDFIGKKPLFLGRSNRHSFITSELKAFDNIEEFHIIPQGISSVTDMHTLTLLQSHVINKTTEGLEDLLEMAVKKRIPEDPFGVFLSGGLDSSIISLLALKYSSNISFYSLGDEKSTDYAKTSLLSSSLNIDVTFIPIPSKQELKTIIEQVVYHTESYNPSIISNGVGTYLLSKQAHQDSLKVVLSGDGADEVFCGYDICERDENVKKQLMHDLHFTELRRVDNAAMAHSLEIRMPFLDKAVVDCSYTLNKELLKGKKILKQLYKDRLPTEIIERSKLSFDRGSGLRSKVVSILTENGLSEREALYKIWNDFFTRKDHKYYSSYPSFDKYIDSRKRH